MPSALIFCFTAGGGTPTLHILMYTIISGGGPAGASSSTGSGSAGASACAGAAAAGGAAPGIPGSGGGTGIPGSGGGGGALAAGAAVGAAVAGAAVVAAAYAAFGKFYVGTLLILYSSKVTRTSIRSIFLLTYCNLSCTLFEKLFRKSVVEEINALTALIVFFGSIAFAILRLFTFHKY